jgi:multiple sugar transport system permease protein
LPGPDWINSETWIYPALALIGLWGIGNFMLINLAGLQSVPTELYEAARIDGAGALKMFRRITIPLMSPILLYNLVISTVVTFQYFTQAYTLTNGRGDPNNATLFINLDLYREAFVFNRMGYAAAIAWLLFVIVMGLTLILFIVARKRVYYAGGDA